MEDHFYSFMISEKSVKNRFCSQTQEKFSLLEMFSFPEHRWDGYKKKKKKKVPYFSPSRPSLALYKYICVYTVAHCTPFLQSTVCKSHHRKAVDLHGKGSAELLQLCHVNHHTSCFLSAVQENQQSTFEHSVYVHLGHLYAILKILCQWVCTCHNKTWHDIDYCKWNIGGYILKNVLAQQKKKKKMHKIELWQLRIKLFNQQTKLS